ncbi:zinc-binding alcohol dehydrogenase family protein [Lysinimonas soli]|uniref:Zinc-binding alcohol dehydrogenase family protein n=1 Tax=Lysinimonas soli TaxID=1074233 RepID=A0ABW0NN49_9MICO
MHAAVVTEFDQPPRWSVADEPQAGGEHEVVVEVVAAALHPRVRSQADGSHYTSTDELPLIPGIDGVGRLPDGSLVYFVLPDTRLGSLAERATIDLRRSVPLPAGTDAAAVAAAMNPGMSSWIALRRRAGLVPGQSVLILGATGSAGRLAVQIARHLGASGVVAAGRDPEALDSLAGLGADAVVSLAGPLGEAAARVGEAAAEVDAVVDYLWGEPAQAVIPALLTRRPDRSHRLAWVQVGAIAGPDLTIASAMLRGANLQLMGSGQGSVTTRGILDELGPLLAEVSKGSFVLDIDPRKFADVEAVWAEKASARSRVVFVAP